MSFCDFKGIWKITEVDMVEETVGHRIAIGGTPTSVKVLCIDDLDGHVYLDFTYQADPERLTTANMAFEITRVEGTGTPNQIFFKSPPTPGSWTAEDNLG